MASLPTLDNVARPKQWGYDASLSDLLLRLAMSPERQLQIITAPAETQRIQTEQTAEDFLPEFGQVFSRNNFTGGAGLDFAHRANAGELAATRYWDSRGVDCCTGMPGRLDGVRLVRDTELLEAETAANLHMVRLPDGTVLYSAGSGVHEIDDPTAANPAITPEDPHTGTANVEDLAQLGDEVFAAVGTDGTARRNAAGVWANLGATATYGLWGVKGRLIGDNGAGAVVDVDTATGAHTAIINLDAGSVINDVIDAGSVILVAASDGNLYTLVDNAGTLELASQTQVTSTDIVTCMAWASGVLILGTEDGPRGRIWRGSVGNSDDNFVVGGVQLLKELEFIPRAAVAARDRIFVAVRDSSTQVALWRYQLATAGVARDFIFDGAGEPVDVIRSEALVFGTVATVGLFREDSIFVPTGYLISPMADFYSPTVKAWVGLTIQAENIEQGTSLDLYIATKPAALLAPDGPLWSLVGRITDPSQIGTELVLPDIRGRYAAVKIKINASADGLVSPRLISFALRSYSDSEDVIVQMPVNVSDYIERPNRQPFRVQGWGRRVYEALLGLDGAYVTLELYRPPLVVKGIVESIQAPVTARGVRGSATVFALVQVRGRIVGSGTGGTGQGTLGVVLLGVDQLGV